MSLLWARAPALPGHHSRGSMSASAIGRQDHKTCFEGRRPRRAFRYTEGEMSGPSSNATYRLFAGWSGPDIDSLVPKLDTGPTIGMS